jgi:hypothetical protein
MKKSILAIALTLVAQLSYASYCSSWTKQDGVSCIFASEGADLYKRQCENPCHVSRNGSGNMGPGCDQEEVCHFNSPTTFNGLCSDWIKDGNANCYNPATQAYEQQWVRACTVGLSQTWCSSNKPF